MMKHLQQYISEAMLLDLDASTSDKDLNIAIGRLLKTQQSFSIIASGDEDDNPDIVGRLRKMLRKFKIEELEFMTHESLKTARSIGNFAQGIDYLIVKCEYEALPLLQNALNDAAFQTRVALIIFDSAYDYTEDAGRSEFKANMHREFGTNRLELN